MHHLKRSECPWSMSKKNARNKCWNFRLEFVTHTSQQTRDQPNLPYDCDLRIHLVFRLLLVLFRLSNFLSLLLSRISFDSPVYMYVHGMRYLHHEVHELDGYNVIA